MHKWLVFISVYMVLFFHTGLVYSIGSIFVDVMETFNASRVETAVIHSTALSVGPGTGFLAGFLIPKFGIMKSSIPFATLTSVGVMSCYFATSTWHLTISFGIVFGVGFINLFIGCTAAISQYFQGKTRLLVLSLLTTGAGFGGMVYPYLLSYLSSMYDFRGALLIIGAICMNSIPGCFLWTSPRTDRIIQQVEESRFEKYQLDFKVNVAEVGDSITIRKESEMPRTNDIFYIRRFPVLPNQQKSKRISITDGQTKDSVDLRENVTLPLLKRLIGILRNLYFVTFCFGSVLTVAALSLTMIFIADIFIDKGLSEDDANLGLLLFNIMNTFGRIVPGALMQIRRVPILFCPLIGTLMAAGFMAGFILTTSKWMTLLFCAFVGIPMGMFHAMFSVVSVSLVGKNNLSIALGLVYTTSGIFNTITGPVTGYVRDTVGSYHIMFYVVTGISGICAVIFLFALVQQSQQDSARRRRTSVFYLTSF